MTFLAELDVKGYAVIEDVLSPHRVEKAKYMFHKWWNASTDLKSKHAKRGVHGIMKVGEASHQKHAWYIKTRQRVQEPFQQIWGTTDLVTGFDGCCYMSPNDKEQTSGWTHADQAPTIKGRQCIQGFVSLTTNAESTLVVYEGSHLIYETYAAQYNLTGIKNWEKIDKTYLDAIESTRRVLTVKAGSLVLWDSRCFHQNQCCGTEERIVQYVCFLPRQHEKNTAKMHEKRIKYYEERRMTSHWPYPLHVNGKQPHTFGDDTLLVDYAALIPPDLTQFDKKIRALL